MNLKKTISCPICKKEYRSLSRHIRDIHRLDPQKVKLDFGFPSLESEELIEKRKNRKQTKATIKKISDSHKGCKNPMFGKVSLGMSGKKSSEKTKELLRQLRLGDKNPFHGKHHREETKVIIGKKASEKNRGRKNTKETLLKMSKNRIEKGVSKKQWEDPDYVKSVRRGRKISPNKSEIFLLRVLQEKFPDCWEFVGDLKFMVGRKNPDFVHNSRKLLIELFGDYWHSKKTDRCFK